MSVSSVILLLLNGDKHNSTFASKNAKPKKSETFHFCYQGEYTCSLALCQVAIRTSGIEETKMLNFGTKVVKSKVQHFA
jgi:hypothetical protein